MKNFIGGFMLGILVMGTVAGAANFYDQKGQPAAPSGSIQQFDYFRARQSFIDVGNMRRNQEDAIRQQRLNPCGR